MLRKTIEIATPGTRLIVTLSTDRNPRLTAVALVPTVSPRPHIATRLTTLFPGRLAGGPMSGHWPTSWPSRRA